MRLSWTLSRYLGLQFLVGIAIVFFGVLCLIFMVDFVELLRRAASRDEVGLGPVLTMALLKLPNVSEETLPFAVLFGAIWTFVRLTRSNELVIARASGVSVWQFLTPAVALAFFIGGFVVTVYNPLAAAFVGRYEQLEGKYLRGYTNMLAVNRNGFWLRQGSEESQSVVHAQTVNYDTDGSLRLERVIVFLYRNQNYFVGRIDAERALLDDGVWRIEQAVYSPRDEPSQRHAVFELPTQLTMEQIRESFASPNTVSFWELPRFIAMARAVGFSALPHRLHWHSVLATPLLLTAMVLLAATFSLRLTRLGGVPQLAGAGILTGFLLYFLSDVTSALGGSGIIPVALAAWTPTIVAFLLGAAMLFHLEDG